MDVCYGVCALGFSGFSVFDFCGVEFRSVGLHGSFDFKAENLGFRREGNQHPDTRA